MTTDMTRTFIDELDSLPPDIPGAHFEPGRLNWYHGAEVGKVKAPGVFYGKETAFTDLPPAPWESEERYAGEIGFSAPELRIAILGWRDQWFIPGDKPGDPAKDWLLNFRAPEGEKIKKLVEYLILIDGLPDPMVLSVSGLHKSKPFQDIIRDYDRGALAQVMRQKRRAFPRWSFWLPIANKRDRDGKTIYEKAKDGEGEEHGSVVTPPALVAPPVLVSKETMLLGIEIWQQFTAAGWFTFKRTPRDTVNSYVVNAVPQLPPGRNIPQQIKEGEIAPF